MISVQQSMERTARSNGVVKTVEIYAEDFCDVLATKRIRLCRLPCVPPEGVHGLAEVSPRQHQEIPGERSPAAHHGVVRQGIVQSINGKHPRANSVFAELFMADVNAALAAQRGRRGCAAAGVPGDEQGAIIFSFDVPCAAPPFGGRRSRVALTAEVVLAHFFGVDGGSEATVLSTTVRRLPGGSTVNASPGLGASWC